MHSIAGQSSPCPNWLKSCAKTWPKVRNWMVASMKNSDSAPMVGRNIKTT